REGRGRARCAVPAVRPAVGLEGTAPADARPAHRGDPGGAGHRGRRGSVPTDARPPLSALRFPGVQVRADLRAPGVRAFDPRARIYARLGRDLAAMLKGDSR